MAIRGDMIEGGRVVVGGVGVGGVVKGMGEEDMHGTYLQAVNCGKALGWEGGGGRWGRRGSVRTQRTPEGQQHLPSMVQDAADRRDRQVDRYLVLFAQSTAGKGHIRLPPEEQKLNHSLQHNLMNMIRER